LQSLGNALVREAEEARLGQGQSLYRKTADGYEVSVGFVKDQMPEYDWGVMLDTDGLRAEAAERAGHN
jgi:hypothetical protein